jgi:chromosome segregation protein
MVPACGGGGAGMRIKQLELVGFKSFPQKVVLEIPPGVTGIVGPNGCGKSNVVDAIRWVLGEQSAKHLRGEDMEAVVFNGNERLGPLGMAEVSLTFANDGSARPRTEMELEFSTLPDHFRDLAEVRITRRYFRSGESEYFINKTACRLKDITELFLGTGVGTRAYAIVEQGRVERLINAKPEERRLFIEEAAGTTLYRSRKLAAERKMERTRENLARVNDVLREIERQVNYLRRQAKKAEEFKRLQAEMRALELRLAGVQWRRLQNELGELDASSQQLKDEEQQTRLALEVAERTQREAVEALTAAERGHVGVREALAVLDAERASLRERVAMLERERQEREHRCQRMTADREATGLRREEIDAELVRVESERDEWAARLTVEEGSLAVREAGLAEARAAVAGAQANLEAAKSALVEHMTRGLETRNGLAAMERRRQEMARQFTKLRAEEAAVEERMREIERQIAARRNDVEELRTKLAEAAGEKEHQADRMRELDDTRRRLERQTLALESSLVQTQSRIESLEEIRRNYEGFAPSVQAIMCDEHHPPRVLGVVADVMDIPAEYERAAAAVLGDRLQYMIVRGSDEGAEAVDMLRREERGRGSFIPVEPRVETDRVRGAESLNGESCRLLDVVRVGEEFQSVAESLLGEVVVVPDLRSGLDIWRRNGVYVTMVTPEGDVISPSGAITGGSDHPVEQEILSRRREIEELRSELADTTTGLESVRSEMADLEESITEAEAALRTLGQDVHDLTLAIVGAEKDIERLELERPQCSSRRDVARYELDALLAEDQTIVEEMAMLRVRLEELSAEREELEAQLTRCTAEAHEAASRAELLAAEVTAGKVSVTEHRERQQAAATRAEALKRQRMEIENRVATLTAELHAAEEERVAIERSIVAAQEREAEQERRRSQLVVDVEAAAAEVVKVEAARREAEQHVRATYAFLEGIRTRTSEVEIARSELRLRSEHLVQSMREKHAAELAETAAELAAEEAVEGGSERLDALRERLSRIGDVNVGAIEELRELEERLGFLRAQKEDLERSLAELERTIQKLNRVSRSRFAETFARANEAFQKIVPRLFKGGEGRLVLTDENNLLETGVNIYVRPPGKRLDTMDPLSGGEKALVAVSLIFSLFLINPTPFCILDEVDAPLDDANVSRFSEMIREMSEHLQCMVVTHNKRTMETADVLYGVTMQEPGVSKVMSVSMR